MNTYRTTSKVFTNLDMRNLCVELKVGLLATINEQGLPHLTLISTLQPGSSTNLIFGQFSEGWSKINIVKNPKIGFLILTLDKYLWRGKGNFTNTAKSGEAFDMFNNIPMFRYNAYFGIHTAYYIDLIEHYGREPLPMGGIVIAALKTMMARSFSLKQNGDEVINSWTRQLINKLSNLKFVSYVGKDGYPIIIPVIQAQTLKKDHVIFAISAYREEIEAIPLNTKIAFFCMSFDMEDVLMRGTYKGVSRTGGISTGSISVDWVYSPMPPKPEQIYPEKVIESVTTF